MLVAWKEIVFTVQNLAIVQKESPGQNTQVSSFAITFPALSDKILHFLSKNPMNIQKNSINIGVRVAKNVSIIFFNILRRKSGTQYYPY